MSSLFLFSQKKWFRRLWLIGLGLVLGYGYAFGFIDDVVLIPAGLGFIVGILSQSLLASLINTVIVLISYVVGIIIFIGAGNLGSGLPFVFDFYQEQIANAFVIATTPIYCWIPAMLVGLVARYFLLKILKKKAPQKS
jgi:hypothetical protein